MPEPAEVTMGWRTQAAPQGLQGPGAPMAGRCWARETSVEMRQGPGEEMQLCPGRGPTADPLQCPCHEKVRPVMRPSPSWGTSLGSVIFCETSMGAGEPSAGGEQ